MNAFSGLNKRRRHSFRRDTLLLSSVLLFLVFPMVVIINAYLAFVTQLDPALELSLSQGASVQRYATAAIRDENSTLSIWKPTTPFALLDNHQKQKYGRRALVGSYSYMDGFGCNEVKACQIHFPFVDLKAMIPLDEALASNEKSFPQFAVDSENNKEIDTIIEYPPAIHIPRRTAEGQTSHHLSYQDFALLTLAGAKEDSVNQDRVLLVSPFFVQEEVSPTVDTSSSGQDWLMGLFDGHGKYGHVVSHFCAINLAQVIAEQVQQHLQDVENAGELDVQKVLTDTFLELDRTVHFAKLAGTTGIVMWRWNNQLAVANAGDSHAYIISYNQKDDLLQFLFETRPHKPNLEEERARIEQLGGQVLAAPPEGGSSRVVIPSSQSDLSLALAMSRSIGDHDGRSLGVIANPTVDVLDLRQLIANHSYDSRLFAIAATDGLLDHLTKEEVARHVADSLFRENPGSSSDPPTLLEACEQLIMKASQRWKELDISYRDDISIVVTAIS